MRVLNSAEKEYRTVAAYQDEELQNMARDQIPVESLHEKAEAELRTIPSDSPFGFMEVLMVHLANWFQSEYMTWMNKPACFACCFPDTIGVGGDEPSEFERADSAGRVEVYECPECTCLTRFARYSDCRVLMRERRGRCGEYSNLFGLFATTMGYDIRLVVDFLDHIWCEFWSDKWNR
jgi:peptide-N4-(N-acetyl-beta-glucosaminyl)asparagine amidase